jgi:hypothetical protein
MINPIAGADRTDYDALWQDIDRLAKIGNFPPVFLQIAKNLKKGSDARWCAAARHDRQSQGSTSSRLVGGLVAGFTDPYMTGLAIATGGQAGFLSAGRSG